MDIDPRTVPTGDMYRFLVTAIVPRPIAFVSTLSGDGKTNLAPFSWFNAISSKPPLIGISINDRGDDQKDTLRNIRETGEFVVNVVTDSILTLASQAAGDWPRDVSEFDVTKLTPRPSERVKAPGVTESPIQLECRLHREIPLGASFLIVGEVVFARVRDDVVVDGRIDPKKLRPVGRLGGENYALVRDVLSVPRPKVSRTAVAEG